MGRSWGAAHKQMAQKNIMHFLEGQDYKQGNMGKDGTGRYGNHHKKKKTTFVGPLSLGEDGERKSGNGWRDCVAR